MQFWLWLNTNRIPIRYKQGAVTARAAPDEAMACALGIKELFDKTWWDRPPYSWFYCPRFQLPEVNPGPKAVNKQFQECTFINLQWFASLSRAMKSHPFAQRLHTVKLPVLFSLTSDVAIRSTVPVSQRLCSKNSYST